MSECQFHPFTYDPDCNACMRDARNCAVCGASDHYVHGNRPPLYPPKPAPPEVPSPDDVGDVCEPGYIQSIRFSAGEDKPLPEDDAIRAAHPTRTGRHDLYAKAMRLVGAKHSKRALVDLVNWLLYLRAREGGR